MNACTSYRGIAIFSRLATLVSVLTAGAAMGAPVPDPDQGHGRNTPPGLAEAALVRHASPNEPISVVMALDLRDHAGVDALIEAQQDPTSPLYHQWISPEEFQLRFGPLPSDLQAAREFLSAHGFTNIAQPTATMIAAEGNVGLAERAFGVTINHYAYHGRSVFANDRDPSLPPGLAGKVAHVGGLDNLTIMFPMHGAPTPYVPPQIEPNYVFSGSNYYLPRDNQVAYGEKAGYFDLGKKGISGAELAVASSFDIQLTDVNDQFTRQGGAAAGYNLLTAASSGAHTTSATCVPNTGSSTGCTFVNGTNHESLETIWDTSVAASVANDAHIGRYLTQDQATTSFAVLYQYLADRSSTIKVVTHSWGLCLSNMAPSTVTADDNALAEAAAGGQAWFVSTGDSGSNDCTSGTNPSVDYPAGSPYVTGAGGSAQNSAAVGTFGADGWMAGYPPNGETACADGGGGEATTGSTEPRPSWQTGTGVPAGTKRLVPDVSMHYGTCTGDANTKSYLVTIGGSLFTVVGTSGDAPQWAGYWAVANQVVGTNLGQAAPLMFRILRSEGGTSYASCFHDVTTGSNGFSAGVGYDRATGVGTPKFDALYPALATLFTPLSSACFTDTTQADFQAGTASSVDPTTTPGSVILAHTGGQQIDQQNQTLTGNGLGFTNVTWRSQVFTAGATGPLTRADINLFCSGCSGADPAITVQIRNTSAGAPGSTVLATTTIPGFSSGAGAFYTATFSTPATVTSGTVYALVFGSTAARTGTYANVDSGGSTYAGGRVYSSGNSGSTWSTVNPTTDLPFITYITTATVYLASGNLASTVKDSNPAVGATTNWSPLSWTASTTAPTTVKFQLATSSSSSGPFTFLGPDGTAATFFTTSPATPSSAFFSGRYLQYKAFLSTTDTSQTPTLNDVTVCYNNVTCTAPTAATSASVDSPSYCSNAAPSTINLTASGGSGTTLHWYSGSCGGTSVGTGTPLNIAAPASTTTYFARWETASCGNSTCASTTVTVTPPPTTATVGGPQTICVNGTTGGLGGNTPTTGTGVWSIVSGGLTGTFNPNNTTPNATFTQTGGGSGSFVLRWTISNSPCTASTANVSLTVNAPPTTATVGGAQTICATGTTAGLGGNTPSSGTGAWSVVSGGTGTFNPNASTPNATFTHTSGTGPVVLRWTISSSPCASSSADLSITIISSCNDNNVCTTDSCVSGACQFVNNTVSCDDGLFCNGTDTCSGGVCGHAGDPCAGGGVCANACNEAADNCFNSSATSCTSDGNVCTDDHCSGSGACVHTANTASCDDGSACTSGDVCSGGSCSGTAITCNDSNPCTDDTCNPATGCVYTNNTSPCSDGNACTSGDTCGGGTCHPGTPVVCNDSNPCTDDTCNPASGCVYTNNTSPCNDGNACTSGDTCGGGTCHPGTPVVCNDSNPCTDDTCNPASGCVYTNNTSPCNDGSACTSGDVCGGGSCAGTAITCNDSNPCTDDTCNPASGCVYTNNTNSCDDGSACTTGDTCSGGVCAGTGITCDDSNPCTDDTCNPGTGCVYTNNTNTCNDGNACTSGDVCSGGVCAGSAITCNDSNPCTDDTCNPASGCVYTNNTSPCNDGNACTSGDVCSGGVCAGNAITCNDSNPCTNDTCNPATGCVYTNNTNTCNDGNACTSGDVCSGGVCAGNAITCNDSNPCTNDTCNPATGCVYTNNTNTCNDGNACTSGDVCSGGVCAGSAITCNDSNPCTDDTCNPASGCLYTNNTSPCNDGNACTSGDVCSGGVCAGSAITCNDSNPCTDDTCNPGTGCVYTNNSDACNDNNACTSGDVCSGGVCAGSAITCNDHNPCTDDTCNPGTGCVYTNNSDACNDNNACTSGDVCSGGVCAGSAITCNDNNPCTDDTCNPATGCVYTNNTDACNDNSACTSGDVCSGGVCAGSAITCNDNNPCTDDTCNPGSGCVYTNNTSPCNDGSACTSGDVCSGGVCAGSAITCNDHNPCTDDTCNPATGCVYTNNTSPCNDGSACTSGDVCSGGVCAGNAITCNDNNPCTDDTCNPATGCVYTNNTSPCSDGNACTVGDVCGGGTCHSGAPTICNDNNTCTDDACNPATGFCVFVANDGNSCTDDNVCTNDACSGGSCVHTPSGACGASGSVFYYRTNAPGVEPTSTGVPGVGIDANGDASADATTDGSGAYSISNLAGHVTLAPLAKYGSPRAADANGALTSLDASFVARGVVGTLTLSPNQQVAGDVTGNGSLSALDASEIARYAVALVNHFEVSVAAGSDWKFLRCDAYAYPGNPGCGAAIYDYNPIGASVSGRNFYAVLYGEVTGNWQPAGVFALASSIRTSPEEQTALRADQLAAERFRQTAPAQAVRAAGSAPADLTVRGWTMPIRAGERRQLTIDLRGADGILALDLALNYDPSRIAIVDVASTGIGSGLYVEHGDQSGVHRIAAYGVLPLSGSGSVLTVTIEALKNSGRQVPLTVSGSANEGGIQLQVGAQNNFAPARSR